VRTYSNQLLQQFKFGRSFHEWHTQRKTELFAGSAASRRLNSTESVLKKVVIETVIEILTLSSNQVKEVIPSTIYMYLERLTGRKSKALEDLVNEAIVVELKNGMVYGGRLDEYYYNGGGVMTLWSDQKANSLPITCRIFGSQK
jgi:hypothetical protein